MPLPWHRKHELNLPLVYQPGYLRERRPLPVRRFDFWESTHHLAPEFLAAVGFVLTKEKIGRVTKSQGYFCNGGYMRIFTPA